MTDEVKILREGLERISIDNLHGYGAIARETLAKADAAGNGWIPVSTPAEDGFYIVLLDGGDIIDWAFDVYGGWPDYVTHYMPRPKAPK